MSHLSSTMKAIEAKEAAEAAERAAQNGSLMEVADAMAAGESIDAPAEPLAPVWGPGDPDVSDWVIYQPRRGEIRRGRSRIAALVTYRYPDARLFDLGIFFEGQDVMDQQRVPEAVGEERGWIVKRSAPFVAMEGDVEEGAAAEYAGASDAIVFDGAQRELRERVERLIHDVAEVRAIVLGSFEIPERSILDMLNDVDGRVDEIMASLRAAKAPPAKPAIKPAAKPAKKSKRGK